MPGTAEAATWWARDRGGENTTWITNYQQSLGSRHRGVIVDLVKELQAETLLEVGCHCGPNLIRLARECPTLEMLGIDVNQDAVTAGNRWANHSGYADRITINKGAIPGSLYKLPTDCVDVALSCYALAYIDPSDIDATLYEMGRISKRAMILVEPSAPQGKARRTITGYQEWAHDYLSRTSWIGTLSQRTTTTVPIDPPVDALDCAVVWAV